MCEVSDSPIGEHFRMPRHEHSIREAGKVRALAEQARADGSEVVVVMGLGFVGTVLAAVVADSVDRRTGRSNKFVIGCERLTRGSYWKIPVLNRGESPVKAEDPSVARMVRRCVLEKNTLVATYDNDCLHLANCVVVAVQCDYVKDKVGDVKAGRVDMDALRAVFETIGNKIPPDCLTLIETTVPPGTTEMVAWPVLRKAFNRRRILSDPLLAHSPERVAPGREYVASMRDYPRVCAGCSREARQRAVNFLREVLNMKKKDALTVMDRPIESETTKVIENSYRATILAFLDEWSLFAERNGIDLIKVIEAIRRRDTHSNIIFPGPGIGGYCLPKDGALGYWAHKHLLGFEDDIFRMTTAAIDINDMRGLHVATLTRDALKNMGRQTAGAVVLVCGASYRQDVADTRNSGSEVVVRKLAEMGAEIAIHDPYVKRWRELEADDPDGTTPLSRFFQNQAALKRVRIARDLRKALRKAEALILAVRHKPYLDLKPRDVVKWVGGPLAVVDCCGILSDRQIREYIGLDCEVKALGRGHIEEIKKRVSGRPGR